MAYADLVIADGATNYYRLGEASGTTAEDSGSGNNDATISGGVTLDVSDGATFGGDGAMAFDGTSGKVVSGADTSQGAGDKTVEFRIKSTDLNTNPVVSLRSASQVADPLYVGVTSGVMFIAADGGAAVGTVTVCDGQWHHCVYAMDGTTVDFYVDGVLDRTQAFVAGEGVGQLMIGWDEENLIDFFPGSIDEVALYTGTQLNATQVADHYAAIPNAPLVEAEPLSLWQNEILALRDAQFVAQPTQPLDSTTIFAAEIRRVRNLDASTTPQDTNTELDSVWDGVR